MEDLKETSTLIAGDKVAGTAVYQRDGDRLGEIHDVMIDKTSGNVAYAVLSFGGLLGIGKAYHPLPWSLLKYDTDLGGYVVDLSASDIKESPAYAADSEPNWNDREYESKIHDFYGVGPYWVM